MQVYFITDVLIIQILKKYVRNLSPKIKKKAWHLNDQALNAIF